MNRTARMDGTVSDSRAPVVNQWLPKGLTASELQGMRETGMTNSAIAKAVNTTATCVEKMIGKTPPELLKQRQAENMLKIRQSGRKSVKPPAALGPRIKELREKAGLSQTDAGAYIGVGQVSYCGYENGSSAPHVNAMVEIAKMFDVSVDYLLGITDNKRNVIFTGTPPPPKVDTSAIDGATRKLEARIASAEELAKNMAFSMSGQLAARNPVSDLQEYNFVRRDIKIMKDILGDLVGREIDL
jgi:Predicted transcriptional regulators